MGTNFDFVGADLGVSLDGFVEDNSLLMGLDTSWGIARLEGVVIVANTMGAYLARRETRGQQVKLLF